MQFFAAQGLATPIDDVWDEIGSNFGPAAQKLSQGLDGHYYFIPMYNYPWVFFHNKSVFGDGDYDCGCGYGSEFTQGQASAGVIFAF